MAIEYSIMHGAASLSKEFRGPKLQQCCGQDTSTRRKYVVKVSAGLDNLLKINPMESRGNGSVCEVSAV